MKKSIPKNLDYPIKLNLLLDKNEHCLDQLEYLNNNLFIKQNNILKDIFSSAKLIFKCNKVTFKQFKEKYNKTIQENIKKINITGIEKMRLKDCSVNKNETIYKLIQDPTYFIKHRYANCSKSRKWYTRNGSYYKKSIYFSYGEIGGIKAGNNYRYEVNNTAIKKIAIQLNKYIPQHVTIKLLTNAVKKHCNRMNITRYDNTNRLYPLPIEKYKEIGNKVYQREGSPKFRYKFISGACIGKGYIRYKHSGMFSSIMKRIIGVTIVKKENKAMFKLNTVG